MEEQKSTYEFTANFWDHKKVELQKQYPVLTDADLIFETGNIEKLINGLCTKLNMSDHQLRELIIKL